MQFASAFAVFTLLAVPAWTDDKTVTPEEAVKKVGETVTVRMEVKSASLRSGVCFLNSEDDYKSEKNFTLFIGKDVLAKFKEAKIGDPSEHYKGKIVDVKGKVVKHRERSEIVVKEPAEIRIVEKK